jgi:hypothetical protein
MLARYRRFMLVLEIHARQIRRGSAFLGELCEKEGACGVEAKD